MPFDFNDVYVYHPSYPSGADGEDPVAAGDSFLFDEPKVVEVGLLLPAVQKVPGAAAPIRMEPALPADAMIFLPTDADDRAGIGDPTTAADDVYIDGNIVTAENYDSTYALVDAAEPIWIGLGHPHDTGADTRDGDSVAPVLMVISNPDFWYQDCADTTDSTASRSENPYGDPTTATGDV